MFFKQTMHQIKRERVFGGTFTFGEQQFGYKLRFKVRTSKMDDESERRQEAGQQLSSIEVKRELFILTVKDNDGKKVDLSDDETYGLLVHLAAQMAANVCNHPLTEGFNELFGQQHQESFLDHVEEHELNEHALPAFLKELLGVTPEIHPNKKRSATTKRRRPKKMKK